MARWPRPPILQSIRTAERGTALRQRRAPTRASPRSWNSRRGEPSPGEVSPRRQQNQAALDVYLRHVAVLNYPSDAALDYAAIRADLRKRGTKIGANDLLIAAHARCLGLRLVTD